MKEVLNGVNKPMADTLHRKVLTSENYPFSEKREMVNMVVRRKLKAKESIETALNVEEDSTFIKRLEHGKSHLFVCGENIIIRARACPVYLGISKSSYHNLRNMKSRYFDESFPAVVEISRNCKGHLIAELDAWIESKKCLPLEFKEEVA